MEKLEEQIEKLNMLFSGLRIPEEEVEEEPQEVIFDYSSEEEVNPFDKIEEGETSSQGRKRSRFEGDPRGEEPENIDREMSNQGFYKIRGKWTKVPNKFQPKVDPGIQLTSDVLDLDCQADPLKVLTLWNNRLHIFIQLEDSIKNLSPSDMFNYILHKTTGNVHYYLLNMPQTTRESLHGSNADSTFGNVSRNILREFLGVRQTQIEVQNKEEEFIWKITNLKICNMCYFENYVCEFQEYYYQLSGNNRDRMKEIFLEKLPEHVASQVKEEFKIKLGTEQVQDTLGGRISICRKWLQRKCIDKAVSKETDINLCCQKVLGLPHDYGCSKSKKFRTKHKKSSFRRGGRWYKSSYKKYKKSKPENKKQFFKKRNKFRRKDVRETCPQGKPDCRCWLCNEEGHYANKCPKRFDKKKENQMLRMAFDLGFEPIEDSDFESDIDVIKFSSEEDSSETDSE